MKFQPSLDRVLVKRDNKEEKVGSIYVAPVAQKNATRGVVAAVGSGGRFLVEGKVVEMPVNYKVGDKVLLPDTGLLPEITVEGETYVLVKEFEVLGKFE